MRTTRPIIGGLMWLIFFVAVGLALARGEPQYRWMARYWFLLIAGYIGAHLVWFVLVPQVSMKLALAAGRRQLGDEKAGREYDLKAASFDFSTRWERLARERLEADGSTSAGK